MQSAPEKIIKYRNSSGAFDAAVYLIFAGAGINNNNYIDQPTFSQNVQVNILGKRSKNQELSSINDLFSGKAPQTLKDLYEIIKGSQSLFTNKKGYNKIISLFDPDTERDVLADTKENSSMDYFELIKCHIEHGIKQIILTGAPGTGKTYTAKKVAEKLGAALDNGNMKYEFVQFHPSYDYTDLVEGIRPVEYNGQMAFKKLDGIFKAFCRKAAKKNKSAAEKKNELYFFLIDEINRADLSKVFGELMYCLEGDKRGEGNRIRTQYQNLETYDRNGDPIADDCFGEGFYIPENVVIIGTMNDIDRSVESMDFALRRRFEFIEFKVGKDMLENAFNGSGSFSNCIKENASGLAERIMDLNEVIHSAGQEFGLNRQYDISQGQFTSLPSTDYDSISKVCSDAWEYKIEPLLREYLRGEDETRIDGFIDECRAAFFSEVSSGQDDSGESSEDN